MRTAVEHLAGLGHTRIGYIGAVPQNVAHIQTPQDRLEAFLDAVGQLGLECDDAWILGSEWTAEAAAHDSAGLLSQANRPTAIVAASDEMAIGVRESARRLQVRVPEDLSIIGIDDFVLSGVLGLTTVRQDVAGQGRAAAELLLRALLDDDESRETIVLPTELVVRESTGPAAR
jgi:DNA-binding LacI/PurR family transcriptional regulator